MLSERDYMDRNPRGFQVGLGGSVVKALLWANALVFIFTGFGTSRQATGLLALGADPIRRLEIWRLGTYMFAHGDWGHILMNMWGVFVFGRLVEQRIGSRRFLHLYLTSGFVGGAIWLLVNWRTPYSVIGASGALFGLLMAAAMAFPNQIVSLIFPPIRMRLKTLVLMFGVIEVVRMLGKTGSGIAHIAHLGGFLGGFLYMRHLKASGGSVVQGGLFSDLRRQWTKVRAAHRRQRFEVVDDEAGPENLTAETDRILDKIGHSGLESLTPEERRTLDRARQRLRRGR